MRVSVVTYTAENGMPSRVRAGGKRVHVSSIHFTAQRGTRNCLLPVLCVCNGLLATVGLGQVRAGGTTEPALVTSGDMLRSLKQYMKPGSLSYRAADVINYVLGRPAREAAAEAGPASTI